MFGSVLLECLANEWAAADLIDPAGECLLCLPDGRSFTPKSHLCILGVMCDSAGRADVMVAHRTQEAWKVWYRCRSFLTIKKVDLGPRIAGFYQAVGASILSGAGCWLPSAKLRASFRRIEINWPRQILDLKRQWHRGESWVGFVQRATRGATRFRLRHDQRSLWHSAAGFFHGWQGHTRRAPPESSLAAAAQRWRPLRWWRATQAIGNYEDWRSQSRWHPSTNYIRGGEELLEEFHGEGWSDFVDDRDLWRTKAGASSSGSTISGAAPRCRRGDRDLQAEFLLAVV